MSNPHRPDIEGLRGLAILLVLLFHLDRGLVPGGFVGVDVFFVISGYLLTASILNDLGCGTFSLVAFYERRVRRIFPALAFVIGITLAAGYLLLTPYDYSALAVSARYAAFGGANILFWRQQGYFDEPASLKPLLHTWSIGVEEQFYLVWPAVIAAVFAAGRSREVLFPIAALTLGGCALSEWYLRLDSAGAYFLMPFRVFELAAGGFLAARPAKPSVPSATLGAACILFSATFYSELTPFPGMRALLPVIGVSMIIAFAPGTLVGRILAAAPLQKLGTISYSLYLIHWPLIVFTSYVAFRAPGRTLQAALLLTSIVAATLMYRFIELPFRFRRGSSYRPWIVFSTVFGCAAALGLMCVQIEKSGGMPSRFSGVQNARTEKPPIGVAPPCLNFYGCDIGALESQRRVLVLGDSHMFHYTQGLDSLLRTEGIKGEGHFGRSCFFAPGLHPPENDLKCRTSRESAFKALGTGNDPVFLGQRWRGYIERAHVRPEGENAVRRITLDELSHHLRNFLRSLAGRRVVIFGQSPQPTDDALKCRFLPKFFPRALGPCGSYPAPLADGIERRINARLLEIAADLPNVTLFDPFTALCFGERCRSEAEGKGLYHDSHHLSLVGSELVVREGRTRILPK